MLRKLPQKNSTVLLEQITNLWKRTNRCITCNVINVILRNEIIFLGLRYKATDKNLSAVDLKASFE